MCRTTHRPGVSFCRLGHVCYGFSEKIGLGGEGEGMDLMTFCFGKLPTKSSSCGNHV